MLKALPVELPGARRTMIIISLRNRSLSPLAELFIEVWGSREAAREREVVIGKTRICKKYNRRKCLRLAPGLPIRHIRCHGEYWG